MLLALPFTDGETEAGGPQRQKTEISNQVGGNNVPGMALELVTGTGPIWGQEELLPGAPNSITRCLLTCIGGGGLAGKEGGGEVHRRLSVSFSAFLIPF